MSRERRNPVTTRRVVLPTVVLGIVLASAPDPAHAGLTHFLARKDRVEPGSGLLLLDYFDALNRDRDVDAFRLNVSGRFSDGSLRRLLIDSDDVRSRRAAVVALGMLGTIENNAAVAGTLRDPDPVTRQLGENALWGIWFRADTPANNKTLEEVLSLISRQKLEEAIALSSRLIDRAPRFAEAYNQRAIAEFFLGRHEESAADCQRVLERNPYHTGALSGLAQCQIQLGRREDALGTLRRASRLQPYNEGLRRTIADLDPGYVP